MMPNNVINEVRLHDTTIGEVRKLATSGKSEIDFSVLLPLPINYWPGSVGSLHTKHFPGTHLDEARKAWGTKWNAYGEPTIERDGNDVICTFQTAWDTPRGWICALFNTLKCQITVKYLSEGAVSAKLETFDPCSKQGLWPEWGFSDIEEGTCEYRRLHKMLWGVEEFEDEEA